MGAQLKYGTAGATGGGFAGQPGSLQPSMDDRSAPRWFDWQRRAPKSWLDRNQWNSLWSFGCRVNAGAPIGSDGAGWYDTSMRDLFEPYSCDGEGTQSKNFLRGTCVDGSDVVVANAIVQGYKTSNDFYLGEVQGNTDGTYSLGVEASMATACYLVAYKAGSPDIAGTTVNTLTPTNVDGST